LLQNILSCFEFQSQLTSKNIKIVFLCKEGGIARKTLFVFHWTRQNCFFCVCGNLFDDSFYYKLVLLALWNHQLIQIYIIHYLFLGYKFNGFYLMAFHTKRKIIMLLFIFKLYSWFLAYLAFALKTSTWKNIRQKSVVDHKENEFQDFGQSIQQKSIQTINNQL
jgi:hypothetical protein